MELIGKVLVGREKVREHQYARVRLPADYVKDWIDKKIFVYKAIVDGETVILLSQRELANFGMDQVKISQQISQVSQSSDLERKLEEIIERKLEEVLSRLGVRSDDRLSWCGGRDLNPRTPTGRGLKPRAFSWLGNPRNPY